MKSKLKKVGITLLLFIGIVIFSEMEHLKAQQPPGPASDPGVKVELPRALYACVCPITVDNCRCIREKDNNQ
ncbi:hypothetical protein [Thermoflexibacter ruber]|uniref:Uncharacterized protein n=1 Tax=Thermoflexibacter ruber TaxID=1003 RepID=A0A1I2FVM5_9BACT|nr:hypothetical protein [Thermoflexibacter ruber]SFF09504.1 hypothetical protein SAMN04488541_1015103 [Thermoflexibacter ruber]